MAGGEKKIKKLPKSLLSWRIANPNKLDEAIK
jgi:hypothetical protein